MLTLNHISKIYPGVVALDDVSLRFEDGRVHALLGENGAGKSTLIKVIAGAIEPNGGTIDFDGKSFDKLTPLEAQAQGVGVFTVNGKMIDVAFIPGAERTLKLAKACGMYEGDLV